jgi:hypothetical protein
MPPPFEAFLCALCLLARHILAPPSPPPPTPWNDLPNEAIFPSNPNKLKPLAPSRVEANSPRGPFPAAGPPKPMNGNIKENPHAPHRSLGSPRKPAKSVRSSARPDAGWKAVPRGDPSQEWLRYRAISWMQVIRERYPRWKSGGAAPRSRSRRTVSGRPLGSLIASLTLPELVIHSSNCPAEVGVD